MLDKRIVWCKWIDPFINNDNDDDEDEDEDEEDEDDDDEVSYRDAYTDLDEAIKHQAQPHHNKPSPSKNIGPVLVGPMGVILINEHNQPSKVFNFWMGHTNFDITDKEKSIIEQTPGVETLDIYTRYRFRISIGRAFDEMEVMQSIEDKLTPHVVEAKVHEVKHPDINRFKEHLSSKYKFWAIFMLPNGEIDYKTGDTQDTVKEEILHYPKEADVLTSWEVKYETPEQKKAGNGRGISPSTAE